MLLHCKNVLNKNSLSKREAIFKIASLLERKLEGYGILCYNTSQRKWKPKMYGAYESIESMLHCGMIRR